MDTELWFNLFELHFANFSVQLTNVIVDGGARVGSPVQRYPDHRVSDGSKHTVNDIKWSLMEICCCTTWTTWNTTCAVQAGPGRACQSASPAVWTAAGPPWSGPRRPAASCSHEAGPGSGYLVEQRDTGRWRTNHVCSWRSINRVLHSLHLVFTAA